MLWRKFLALAKCQNQFLRYLCHSSTQCAIQKTMGNRHIYWQFLDKQSPFTCEKGLAPVWRNRSSAKCSTSTTTSQQQKKALIENNQLSHVDKSGKVNMVDIREKPITHRIARATGLISLGETAFHLLKENQMKKGDVLTVADVAGVMSAKETSRLIPLCHTVPLNNVNLTFLLDETKHSIRVISEASTQAQTGVEMEALMAASVSLLTIYDMCKAVSKEMVISDIRLVMKTGGKEDFHANDDDLNSSCR